MSPLRHTIKILVAGALCAQCAEPAEPDYWCDSAPISVEIPTHGWRFDVLFVIDSSGWMHAEQDALIASLPAIGEGLMAEHVDIRFAVVDTDLRDVGFALEPGLSKRSSPPCHGPDPAVAHCARHADGVLWTGDYRDAAGVVDWGRLQEDFRCLASVGNCASGIEQGLAAMEFGLDPDAPHALAAGFPRQDANLVVVFVSDEDDCSTDGGWQPESDGECYWASSRERLAPVSHYAAVLEGLVEENRDVHVAALVGPDDLVPQPEEGDSIPVSCISQLGEDGQQETARAGDRYFELAVHFEGIQASICAADFGPFMMGLGRQLDGAGNECLRYIEVCSTDSECPGSCLQVNGLGLCDDFDVELEGMLNGRPTTFRSQGPLGATTSCDAGGCVQQLTGSDADFEYLVRPRQQACNVAVRFRPEVADAIRGTLVATYPGGHRCRGEGGRIVVPWGLQ